MVVDNILAKIIFYSPNIAAYNLQNRNILRVYKNCYARLLWQRYFDANGRGNVRRRDVSVRCEPPSVQRRFAVTECVPNVRSISSDNNALFEIASLQPINVITSRFGNDRTTTVIFLRDIDRYII